MALCEVCSASNFEDLSEIFLKIFDTRKSVASFLKAVIEMEVNATGESTLSASSPRLTSRRSCRPRIHVVPREQLRDQDLDGVRPRSWIPLCVERLPG